MVPSASTDWVAGSVVEVGSVAVVAASVAVVVVGLEVHLDSLYSSFDV